MSHASRTFSLKAAWLPSALLAAVFIGTGFPDAAAQVPDSAFDYARTKAFTYNANGTLQSETAEPTNAPLCVATTYGYDSHGNVTSTTVANCSGASGRAVFVPRAASAAFAAMPSQGITTQGALTANVTVSVPAGLLPTSSQNALSHAETREYDPRFGAVTKLVGPNGLATSVVIDDFGRKIRELRADGTSTLTWHCVIGSGQDTSSNTTIGGVACPTPASGEAPAHAVRLVHSETRDANGSKMGPFVRTYVDKLGRQIRTATESFDGPNQPAGRAGAVVVADTVFDQYGAKVIETQTYFLASGSTATAGGNDVGAVMTAYDELGRSIATYSTDPNANASHVQTFGGPGTVGYGSYGSRCAATTTYTYQGLRTITTNEKGQTRIEERSARGDILRVTDATGAQIAYLPDAFGNVVRTLDALQNRIAIEYDHRGLKTLINDPDKGVTMFCYDALGQVKAQQNSTMRGGNTPAACPDVSDVAVNPNGTVATPVQGWTTFAYDRLGRLTQRFEPEFASTWSYDQYSNGSTCAMGVGKLCEVTTSNGVAKKIFYDSVAREISNRVDITSGPSFASAVSYDATTGRLATKTYPTGLRIGYSYTTRGFLNSLVLKTAATVAPLPNAQGQTVAGATLAVDTALWQASAVNAKGAIEQDRLSNGVVDTTTYEASTGRVLGISAGANGSVLSHQYTWDGVNNLLTRIDNNGDGVAGAVSETFGYDAVNRLSQYAVVAPAIPNLSRSVTLQYNALGLLLYKSDVGIYSYPAQGAGSIRPHAVRAITGALSATYTADLNGNITGATAGKYTTLTYTSFDNVSTAAGGGHQYTWQYDENHARVKETRVANGNTRTLWYLHPDNVGGLGFESEVDTNPAVQSNRHFISADGRAVGVLVSAGSLPTLASGQAAPAALASITLNKVEYWHKDHLGSLSATTDHLGNATQRYAYDPFGKRRYTNGRYDEFGNVVVDWSPSVNYGNARGFTGHEGLDDIGLVNMNGRLYDATTGLFVQADPHVTDPLNLQNYNRYAYVLNNPLNATDPSGFDPEGVSVNGANAAWGFLSSWVDLFSSLSNVFGGGPGSPTGKSDGIGSDGHATHESSRTSGKDSPVANGGHQRSPSGGKSANQTAWEGLSPSDKARALSEWRSGRGDGYLPKPKVRDINRAFEQARREGDVAAMQKILDLYVQLHGGDPSSALQIVAWGSVLQRERSDAGLEQDSPTTAAVAIAAFGLGLAGNTPSPSTNKSAAELLQRMKGMSASEREKVLLQAGFVRTNVSNSAARNETWRHADGSEVRVHPYGNVNASQHKSGNNAHMHKQNPAGQSLNDRGMPSTDPNATHIGLPNPSNLPSVRGRPHGL